MKRDFLLALFLSILFTIALMYMVLVLPILLARMLLKFFPDVPVIEHGLAEKIINQLRPFGYLSFILVISLSILGFLVKKYKLSVLGGLSLYLPVYGYFTYTMFFLAGIGVLRVLWLPLIDASPLILRLGDMAFLPIYLVYSILAIISRNLAATITVLLCFSLFVLGLWLFSFGVFTWLYGRFRGVEIVDFWIYRFSRHPQYLGFLVWSYGFTLLTPAVEVLGAWILPIPSLIWLVTALIIIGVALNEEIEMIRVYGDRYLAYREKTPFMMPLPRKLSTVIRWPVKLILGKETPEKRTEIVIVIIVYLVIFVLLSVPIALYYQI